MMGWVHREREPLWQRLLLAPLSPPSRLFGAAAATRLRLYQRGLLRQAKAPIPIISVGNIAVGGAGKTPVVMELAARLQARGRTVAVLASGYKGKGRGARVVSHGDGPLLSAEDAGDEPLLIASRCPGVKVLVGPSRAELATIAAEHLRADVAILDDGFQHLGLARDLDLVVLDGSSPFGNRRLLPRGPLREPPEALSRADLCWISKVDEGSERQIEEAASFAERLTGQAPIRSRYKVCAILSRGLEEEAPPAALEGRRVLLLAGLARPDSFRSTLRSLGAKIVDEALFADHHPFSSSELAKVVERAQAAGAEWICATEKDAMRLPPELLHDERIRVVRVESEIVEGSERLDEALDQLFEGACP